MFVHYDCRDWIFVCLVLVYASLSIPEPTRLQTPPTWQAGPDLIRATLHTFNLAFGDDQYPVALSAGIFPALKNLLSWVDEASDEAAALALAGASNGPSIGQWPVVCRWRFPGGVRVIVADCV